MKRKQQLRLLLAISSTWLLGMLWFFGAGSGAVALTVVDEDGQPVAGAIVYSGDQELAATDASGAVEVDWSRSTSEFTVQAPGYTDKSFEIPESPTEPLTVRIETRRLRGVVRDADGRPVPGVYVASGYGQSVTGPDGRFLVQLAEPGPVEVFRPAWQPADYTWDGSPGETTVVIEPRVVRAVHIAGDVPADPQRWDYQMRLAENTELNGAMLDLKDEDGLIFYDSQVGIAREAGSVRADWDLPDVVGKLDEQGLYVIGRIVTFQDPRAARSFPDLAVFDSTTGRPYQKAGQYFLDPSNTEARGYALDLAVEACQAGVDEIQFDYIRFPDGFPNHVVFDAGTGSEMRADQEARITTIESFMLAAREALHPLGCAVAADIFGFITTAQDDGGIGQKWSSVTDALDVVSPMVYPALYGPDWYGYARPFDNPGPIVDNALSDGLARLDSGAVIRPWLQDWAYTDEQVREQIDSAEKHGLGWMLWNPFSNVSEGALDPAP